MAEIRCESAFGSDDHNHIDDNRRVARHLKHVAPEVAAELMGGVGFKIFETQQLADGKSGLQKREPSYSEVRDQASALMGKRPTKISPELNQLVTDLFHPTMINDETVLIELSHSGWHSPSIARSGQTHFAFQVSMRMERLYQKTATWIYQKEGLEPLDPSTSGTMVDEIHNYAIERKPLDYFMLFDKKVWNEQMRFFEECWLERFPDPSSEALEIKFITPDVFWPAAGVALARPINESVPVEVKRYFKNELGDPLELLTPSQSKDDYTLRNQLLLSALETLPKDQELEIHSHTRTHTIAYRKLGFTVTRQVLNPDYPDVTVDLLHAKNRDVITKIKALLQSRSATVQSRLGK